MIYHGCFLFMQRKITSLKAQKRNPQRVNVFLDGEYAFGLTRYVAAWLQIGQELEDDRIAQLLAEDEVETAHQKAIRFINYRPRTEYESQKKLSELGYSDDVISIIIERLKNVGLIDDNNYASSWITDRIMNHPTSPRFMSFELRRRGVDQEIIDSALADIDETQLAFKVSMKKIRTLKFNDPIYIKNKLYSYLYRQGFDSDVCKLVIYQIFDSEESKEITHDEEALS